MKGREALDKRLYKIVLYSLKIIPMVIAGIYVLNTILSYFYIDLPVFSYIVQFLFIGFIYSTSLAFKFCAWHRVFIHYIFITLLLNIIDYHWGLPLSNRGLLLLYGIAKADYINSLVHEAEHVKQTMLKEYDVEDEGENPAYTIGYLVKRMWEVYSRIK